MNRSQIFCLLVFTGSVTSVLVAADSDDSTVAAMVTNLEALHLVTEQPHPMLDSTITFCRPADSLPHNIHDGFADAAFCNVYVSDAAKPIMLSGRGTYPVGSFVVKSKLRSVDKSEIELFTVMRKMAKGYDPDNGDWEYSVVDGRSRRFYSRGKTDSCISCHRAYRDTDFVTRTYMQRQSNP